MDWTPKRVTRSQYDLEWSSGTDHWGKCVENQNDLEKRLHDPGSCVSVGPSFPIGDIFSVSISLFLHWNRGRETAEDAANSVLCKMDALHSIGVIHSDWVKMSHIEQPRRIKVTLDFGKLQDTSPHEIAKLVLRMCKALEIDYPICMMVWHEFEVNVLTEKGIEWIPEGRYLLDEALTVTKSVTSLAGSVKSGT